MFVTHRVGTGFRVRALANVPAASECNVTAVLNFGGHGVRFAVFLGDAEVRAGTLVGKDRMPQTVSLVTAAQLLNTPGRVVTVLKVTEPFGHDFPCTLTSVGVTPGIQHSARSLEALKRSRAATTIPIRIDVYGDSDSAGYGVDGSRSIPSARCFAEQQGYENFADGWIRAAAALLRRNDSAIPAEASVQAVSGICVTNGSSPATLRQPAGQPYPSMPEVVRRSLQTVDSNDYVPMSWRPDVIVLYIGSNDYAGPPEPSSSTFQSVYQKLVETIRGFYGQPYPPVLHVCGGEIKPCVFIAEVAKQMGEVYTTTGDTGVPKAGCVGHRNTTQQARLGAHLAPIIAKLVPTNRL